MQETLILIVDDLINWRTTLNRLFSALNYRCDMASSRQEAIEMLSKQYYKLVILDIRLNEGDVNNKDGIEIVNWLVDTHSLTKAIMLSGHATTEHVRQTSLSGVVVGFYLKEEIDNDRLIESVKKVMESV